MPCLATEPFGRLIILQVTHPLTLEDLARLPMTLRATLSKMPPPGGILATDLTQARVLPPDVAAAFVQLMRSGNSLLVASALLTSGVGTFAMQVERVVKEAGHPNRQAFHNRADYEAWLLPKLTPEELSRLSQALQTGHLSHPQGRLR